MEDIPTLISPLLVILQFLLPMTFIAIVVFLPDILDDISDWLYFRRHFK